MLVRRELFGVWPHPYLVSAHAHLVLVGFVIFLIFGVALWIFPRPRSGDERYRPEFAEATYWLLLAGTSVRFLAEASRASLHAPELGWAVVGGATAQVAAMGLFFWTMWTRIRPSGSHLREAKGERF